ncbi:MAG: ERCC4 domain-containing protein [Gemmataceae bacterium]|nr:ERCC4 domain-containing protein [Gemmataceae bacterium]
MASKTTPTPYTVVRDTREKEGWTFPAGGLCQGTVVGTLRTGDYSLKGYEKLFVIERKGSIGEFARNIVQSRFDRELVRLESFAHPFMVLEFTMEDIVLFPQNANLPDYVIKRLRISPQFIMKRLNDFQVKYRTHIILAGKYGRHVSSSLFKRITEQCPI